MTPADPWDRVELPSMSRCSCGKFVMAPVPDSYRYAARDGVVHSRQRCAAPPASPVTPAQ